MERRKEAEAARIKQEEEDAAHRAAAAVDVTLEGPPGLESLLHPINQDSEYAPAVLAECDDDEENPPDMVQATDDEWDGEFQDIGSPEDDMIDAQWMVNDQGKIHAEPEGNTKGSSAGGWC